MTTVRNLTTSVLMNTLAAPGWDAHVDALFRDQTVTPDEVIVVVDRPTSIEERKTFEQRHPRVTFLFNERNVGQYISANRGIAAARSDIIFRLDDDDHCLPQRIERQLETFTKSGADLVFAFAEGVESNADSQRRWLITYPTDEVVLKRRLLRRNLVVHSTLAFRRERVQEIGGYDASFYYAGDYAFYLRCIRAGLAFAVTPEVLLYRFYGEGSITVRKRRQQVMFSAAARLLHAAFQNDPADFAAAAARRLPLLFIPVVFRRWRRSVFRMLGRGA